MSDGIPTLDDMKRAFEQLTEQNRQAQVEHARRVERFWNTVPEHFVNHPLILRMATYVETGTLIHPKDYEQMRDEYLRLVGRTGADDE